MFKDHFNEQGQCHNVIFSSFILTVIGRLGEANLR